MSVDEASEQQEGSEQDAASESEAVEWPQPSGIFAGDLYRRGVEYIEAFEHLSDHMPDHKFSAYFLLVHSIELFLKSFLVARGFHKDLLWKKPLGHNLPGILAECVKHELRPSAKFSSLIAHLQEMNSDYDFRYPTIYRISVPRPSDCIEILSEILKTIYPAVERANIDAKLNFASETRHLRPRKIKWKS
ncbi:MAG: hypothetical protein PGN34_07595 [Methylobacterium frigidaeris]